MVFNQLYYITNREEIFIFSNKKCRIYATCGVSQMPMGYQKKEGEKMAETEEILSSSQITASEKNRHKMLEKYVESISHSIPEQAKKIVYFNTHIWGI